jgi:PAS domain S-box-containing protein
MVEPLAQTAVATSHPTRTATIPFSTLFKHMAATVQDVFWLGSPDMKHLYFANPAFERVWGMPFRPQVLSPSPILAAAHPEDIGRARQEFATLGETPRDIRYRIVRPDGSIRWVCNRAHRIPGEAGRPPMLAGAAADVTDQKLFQRSLIESHARFVTVLDGIEADIYVADPATREILFANTHLRRSVGRDLLGKRCHLAIHGRPEPCQGCTEPQPAGAAGLPREGRTWESETPGTGKWHLCTARPITWVDGRTVTIRIATDITRLKQLEANNQSIQAHLQQSQKMEAIGTLAGGIAHDFNNILTAVMGYTEIALMEVADGAPVKRNLEQVLQAGTRARELVRQILTFSRQTEHELKPVQLSLIIQEALNLMRASLPSTITIVPRLNSGSSVLADPTQIHQVLINLCTNAAHAMSDRVGMLTVSLDDVEPDRAFMSRHPELTPGVYQRLSVQDSGHGIDPAVRERIFEPFFTTKEREEGTGMGLSVVLGIVRSHKGIITVDSVPGKGSTFDIYLPVVGRGKPEVGFDPVGGLPSGHERILLVDDEDVVLDLGRRMLEHLGYRVTPCRNGLEAFKLFMQNPWRYDLVITDMTMPKMTGDALAKKLLLIRSDIPIVLCTGYNRAMTRERARSIGIREYAMKPLSIRELAHTVRKVLDHVRPGPEPTP